MRPVVFRTLKHEYRLVAPDDEARAALAFMAIEPAIEGATLTPVELAVRRRDGFLEVDLPDGRTLAGTPAHLLSALHGLIWADIAASEPAAVFVHGATVLGPWGRAILVGNKGTGKSTLALHLVATGYDVEGDEHLVVRDQSVIARPRTLRVKPGTLRYVPELAAAVTQRPHVLAWDGLKVYAVEPSINGRPWRIVPGRLDRLVFLEANHGGRSMLAPLSANEALQRLLEQSLLPPRAMGTAFARLRALTQTLEPVRLALGDLDGAVRQLQRLA